jgi:hypothetical protein
MKNKDQKQSRQRMDFHCSIPQFISGHRAVVRALCAAILSCASALGADTDAICVVTSSRTNLSGAISTKNVFTRGAQTNLVRVTRIKAGGVVQIRIQKLYHDGALVGMFFEAPDSSSTSSEAGSPYGLDWDYGISNQLRYVTIVRKDGEILDMFACTNGAIFPLEPSKLRVAIAAGRDADKLISGARKETHEGFDRKVDQLIEKYKLK